MDNLKQNSSYLFERQVYLVDELIKNDVINALKRFSQPLPTPNPYRITNLFKNEENELKIHSNLKGEIKIVISRPKKPKHVSWEREIMFDIFFAIKNNELLDPLYVIGSDEVGKSDYFGPIVVSAVAWKSMKTIFNTGNKDSKKITFQEAAKFEKKIEDNCLSSFSLITPQKMNNFLSNYNKKLNLNHLLLYYHIVNNSNVYKKIEKERKSKMIFGIDDFLNNNKSLEAKYLNDLNSMPEIKEFMKQETKVKWIIKGDETNDLIKLASINAKYVFHLEMNKVFHKLSKYKDIGSDFRCILGNSGKLKSLIFELVKMLPKEELQKLIKPLYWKTFFN